MRRLMFLQWKAEKSVPKAEESVRIQERMSKVKAKIGAPPKKW